VPRGAHNDGGRPTGIAHRGEVSNCRPLLDDERHLVVNGAGKGGVRPVR